MGQLQSETKWLTCFAFNAQWVYPAVSCVSRKTITCMEQNLMSASHNTTAQTRWHVKRTLNEPL